MINIGLEFASGRDSDLRLESFCDSVYDLFGSTYITLGIVDRSDRTLRRFFSCGADATARLKNGETLSGILATVVAERRTVRGENPGGDLATLQFPWLEPEVQSFLASPIASPSHVYGWICLVRNDGTTFTDEDENLVMALAGQVGRIYALEHEILERKQAESALRHERDLAQQYLDTAEIILLALDNEARVTLVNRYACSVFGWSADELLGRNWIDTAIPHRLREAMREEYRHPSCGELFRGEVPALTKSGEERLFEWRTTPLRDAEGHITGWFSSGTDLTERNQTLQALRTAEERMRFALQSANVGIWDMDYTTGALVWSETLEAHYGLEPGTFEGTFESFIERVHPDDRESLYETLAIALKSGGDFSVQNRSIGPDGMVRWLNGAGRVQLGEHGQPVRAVGISLDVTERRTAEEKYQQAHKMEAIGRLASGVAHDFNNLLTVILGFAELLNGDVASANQHGKDVAEIIKAAQRASGLTKQLLAFSRQQVLHATALDVNGLITEMTGMLERLIGEHIDISLALAPNLHLALADRSQLEQVLMNLIVNARDAMPDGGSLTIETTNVDLESSSFHDEVMMQGRYVMLAVTDTGSGMTKETQRRVFEPFFTTKETGKGTGLGLSTTYGIVKQSKGYIWVYSELGRGTTFKVYLPCAESDDPSHDSSSLVATPHKNGSETVLLVEDEEGVRHLSKRILVSAGYKVLESANGDDAEKLFERNAGSIDLVVTDVIMPVCGGPELLSRLRVGRPDIKVLYMSGYTDQSAAHQVGIDHDPYVQKPFTAAELIRHVREALD
jgi:PAS domain S-box-containing protein